MKLVGVMVLSLATVGCLGQPVAHVGDPPFDIDMGGSFFPGGPSGPQPQFGATVTAATPPHPLSGGTLLMIAGGTTAFAADPDRDQAYFVDLDTAVVKSTVALSAGDEPGRAVEDAAGKVHLILRSGGAVAIIDPATSMVTERKAVCAAPRGIAYDAANDRVHVACAGGELVSLPAAGGDAVRTLSLERDLRDVAVVGSELWVSTLRTAQIIVLDNTAGATTTRLTLPDGFNFSGQQFSPSVAWRMMSLPNGQVGVVHQRGIVGPVMTTQGGYGGDGPGDPCGGIVTSGISFVDGASRAMTTASVMQTVLPVDFALAPKRGQVAVVAAGNGHTPQLPQVVVMNLSDIVVPGGPPDGGAGGPPDGGGDGGGCDTNAQLVFNVIGEPTALAYDVNERLWVQTREPATLTLISPTLQAPQSSVTLSTDSRADTAFAVFHSNSGANVACASCHPEGGEDGRTWDFDMIGERRTQTLRGHVGGTEPFHWSGDLPNFGALVGEVYLHRMGGPSLADDQQTALLGWIDTIPRLPQSPPADAAAVTRGSALFYDTAHGACTTCHSGPQLTNNTSVDVGTGGVFQVPRLVGIAWRAPFLHDGCAATLADRFGAACGGTTDLHGATSSLTPAQINDLIAYLQTL